MFWFIASVIVIAGLIAAIATILEEDFFDDELAPKSVIVDEAVMIPAAEGESPA